MEDSLIVKQIVQLATIDLVERNPGVKFEICDHFEYVISSK